VECFKKNEYITAKTFILINGAEFECEEGINVYNQIDKMGSKYHSMLTDLWLRHDLFSLQWWFIIILNVLFLILLFVLIDRYRILLISLAFMIAYSIVGIADEVGSFFDAWSYPHQLIVFTHRFNAVDFAAIPAMLALVYQFFSKWKNYWIASILVSAVISFIGIPLFVFFGLYKIENWNYFYSFLVMILLFVLTKAISDFVGKKAEKYPH
jgi:hypothetical protein